MQIKHKVGYEENINALSIKSGMLKFKFEILWNRKIDQA